MIKKFAVKLFMASVDDVETNTRFAKQNDAPFVVLSDAKKQAAKAYGVMSRLGFSERWTFYIGAQGKILKIDKEVKPLSAGTDIARNLAILGIPESK